MLWGAEFRRAGAPFVGGRRPAERSVQHSCLRDPCAAELVALSLVWGQTLQRPSRKRAPEELASLPLRHEKLHQRAPEELASLSFQHHHNT